MDERPAHSRVEPDGNRAGHMAQEQLAAGPLLRVMRIMRVMSVMSLLKGFRVLIVSFN